VAKLKTLLSVAQLPFYQQIITLVIAPTTPWPKANMAKQFLDLVSGTNQNHYLVPIVFRREQTTLTQRPLNRLKLRSMAQFMATLLQATSMISLQHGLCS